MGMVDRSSSSRPLFEQAHLLRSHRRHRDRPFVDLVRTFSESVRTFSESGRVGGRPDSGITTWSTNLAAGQRQALDSRGSYRACFKPQLPDLHPARLTKPTDASDDPFMGRARPLQGRGLMGRRPAANRYQSAGVLMTRPDSAALRTSRGRL